MRRVDCPVPEDGPLVNPAAFGPGISSVIACRTDSVLAGEWQQEQKKRPTERLFEIIQILRAALIKGREDMIAKRKAAANMSKR